MKYLHHNRHALYFSLGLLCLCCALFSVFSSSALRKEADHSLRKSLHYMSEHSAAVVQSRVRGLTVNIATLSTLLAVQSNQNEQKLAELLSAPTVSRLYAHAGLLFPDGRWYCSTPEHKGKQCPLPPELLPPQAPAALKLSGPVLIGKGTSEPEMAFLAPINAQETLLGTLVIFIPAASLYTTDNTLSGLSNDALHFLTDRQGYILHSSGVHLPADQSNFLHYLNNLDAPQSTRGASLARDMASGRAGLEPFELKNGIHWLSYAPIGEGSWYTITLLLPSAVRQWQSAAHIPWYISVLLLLLGTGLLWKALQAWCRQNRTAQDLQAYHQRRFHALQQCLSGAFVNCASTPAMPLKEVSEGFTALTGYTFDEVRDLYNGNFMKLVYEGDRACLASILGSGGPSLRTEYRIQCKDGRVLWVRDRRVRFVEDDHWQWFCILENSTENMRLAEARQLQARKVDALIDIAGTLVYDYDPAEGIVRASKSMLELFDMTNPPFIFDRPGLDTSSIHPDDIDTYMRMRTRMLCGSSSTEGTLRVRDLHGAVRWYQLRMQGIMDTTGRCAHIVGRMTESYDPEGLHQDRQMAQHDPLTGLLNGEGIKSRTNAYITHCEPDSVAAFCLVEVDDFLHMHQEYGILASEELLVRLSANLKGIFRPTDLLARIDDHLFAILARDLRDRQGVAQKFPHIQKACALEINTNRGSFKSSVSMGISFFPSQGRTFEQLLNYAEAALLTARKNGRAGCIVFNEKAQP